MKEIIYVTQSIDFKVDNKIYRLKKTLYGLKQSLRVWYNTLIVYLKKLNFEPIAANYSIFTNDIIIIEIYINDILLTELNKKKIQGIKDKLYERFKITDLGSYVYYLGIIVTRDRANRILRLGQTDYV